MATKRIYPKHARNTAELDVVFDLFGPDYDEVEIKESDDGSGYHVSVAVGEHRTGFGMAHRDLEAILQVEGAKKAIAAQIAAKE